MIVPPPGVRDVLAAIGLPASADAGAVDDGGLGGSPWYVRLLIGAVAWASALSIMGFLAATGIIGEGTFAVWGLAAMATALFIARRVPRDSDLRGALSEFAAQLALVLSLLARVMVVIGLSDWTNSDLLFMGPAMVALEIVFFLFYPDFFQRFVAAGLVGAWLLLTLGDVHDLLLVAYLRDLVTLAAACTAGWLWLSRPRLLAGQRADLVAPAAYGLVVFVVCALLQETIAAFGSWLPGIRWLATVGLAAGVLCLLVFVRRALGRPLVDAGAAVLGALVCGVAGATWTEPGIMAALGVLVLAFHARDGLLYGFGVAALAGTLWHFFYSLHWTMLEKSELLVAGGLIVLAGRWLWLRLAEPLAAAPGDPPAGAIGGVAADDGAGAR
ncbi:MAG: DUF4401 domain-containing protein [Ardenticatenales bacterium]